MADADEQLLLKGSHHLRAFKSKLPIHGPLPVGRGGLL
jgi:hypothetical protein